MRILVTGASGYVGSLLVPRLLSDGHAVRALARDEQRIDVAELTVHAAKPTRGGASREGERTHERTDASRGLEVFSGDVLTGAGLARALDGVEVAYYLIHSMERPRERTRTTGDPGADPARMSFSERERIGAENFAAAAIRAGVRRIVYLGGPVPHWDTPGAPVTASRHLASRATVERILCDAVPGSVTLRASIVIGARSRSFRFLVRLVERMPVLALPAWRAHRSRPIDERDIVAMLTAAATMTAIPDRALDVGGPEILSYGEMIERIADSMLLTRPTLGLAVNATPLTAPLAAAIAGEDPELVGALMESLQCDLLPGGADGRAHLDAAETLGVILHSFDAAVEHALAEWERTEPLAAR